MDLLTRANRVDDTSSSTDTVKLVQNQLEVYIQQNQEAQHLQSNFYYIIPREQKNANGLSFGTVNKHLNRELGCLLQISLWSFLQDKTI